jgi:23S rRNA (adenine2503-C2)-methyltransferase
MVNVIPWNPAAELPFREPDPGELEGFLEEIERHGLSTTRRFRRGRGVNGACGQLAVLKREGREGSYISRGGSP